MPQASDELRAKMEEYFGDPISESGPIEFLEVQGYTCDRKFVWHPPKPFREMTEKEGDCLDFLCDEWDYGYECGGQE